MLSKNFYDNISIYLLRINTIIIPIYSLIQKKRVKQNFSKVLLRNKNLMLSISYSNNFCYFDI